MKSCELTERRDLLLKRNILQLALVLTTGDELADNDFTKQLLVEGDNGGALNDSRVLELPGSHAAVQAFNDPDFVEAIFGFLGNTAATV